MKYNVDIKKLGILLLPTFLRQKTILAYLQSLLKPLIEINYNCRQYRNDNLYKLSHNSQIYYLKKALNDRFDAEKRRIIITDGNRYKRQYIYTDLENKPFSLSTNSNNSDTGRIMFLRREIDFADTGIDFLVLAPQETLTPDNYEMNALIKFYKLASKQYNIESL